MNDWLVARIDTVDLDGEARERVIGWVSRVSGLPADAVRMEIAARAVISQDDRDGSYQLHLSRIVQRDGRPVVDLAAEQVWMEPLVYPLVERPEWELTVRDGVPFVTQIGDA